MIPPQRKRKRKAMVGQAEAERKAEEELADAPGHDWQALHQMVTPHPERRGWIGKAEKEEGGDGRGGGEEDEGGGDGGEEREGGEQRGRRWMRRRRRRRRRKRRRRRRRAQGGASEVSHPSSMNSSSCELVVGAVAVMSSHVAKIYPILDVVYANICIK